MIKQRFKSLINDKCIKSNDGNSNSSAQLPSAIAQLLAIPLSSIPSTSQVTPISTNLNVSAFANLDLTAISPDLIQQVRNDYQRQANVLNELSETTQPSIPQLPTPVHSGFIDTSSCTFGLNPTSSAPQTSNNNDSLPTDYEGILAALKKFQTPPQDPRINPSPSQDPRVPPVPSAIQRLQDPRIKPISNSQSPSSYDSLAKAGIPVSHSQPPQDPRTRPKPSIFQPQVSRVQRNPRVVSEQRTKPNIFRQRAERTPREDSLKHHDSRGKGYVDRDAVSTHGMPSDPRSVIKYDDYLGEEKKISPDDHGRYNPQERRKRSEQPPKEIDYPHKLPRTRDQKPDYSASVKIQNKLPVFEFSDPSNDPLIPKGPRADYISADRPYPIDKTKRDSHYETSGQLEPVKPTAAPTNLKKNTTISPAVLIELSKIAENGTIFAMLDQIRRMQVDREEELFEQRKRMVEDHDKERNKLHAKEILGQLDPREAEALERRLFTELRALDKNIVAEMDKIIQKQQQALQDANVPLFFTTTDKDAIAKQHKILALLSEMAP
ncbi:hypothetical protein K7432_003777 [Basidiobolus ranarum]|uniref:Uncharacterized protein n=1 Tax=Basidiobolus ranarum TaxID=34480 RepID=A0ABR2WZ88_9FUNG